MAEERDFFEWKGFLFGHQVHHWNNDDEKLTKYETQGLQIGENQPSLHYNCRSILIPYK